MAKSTQPITDLQTIYTTGFSPTTIANSNAPAGVIQDMPGNVQGLIVGLQDVKRRAIEVMKDVDVNDPLKATLQGIIDVLV